MNVIELMDKYYPAMSRTQKQIADYVLANFEEACFLSLRAMGEKTGTTEVTILNFVKKLGFESFITFKKSMQAYISRRLSPTESEPVYTGSERHYNILESSYQNDLDTLVRTYQTIDKGEVFKAAEMIQNARTVYFAGNNTSETLALIMKKRLMGIGIKAELFYSDDYSRMSEQLVHVSSQDLFVVISFPTYHHTINSLANVLHKHSIPVISITDKITAPAALNAKVPFVCASDTLTHFNSYLSPLMVCNLIMSAITVDLKRDINKVLTLEKELKENPHVLR